jgi:hypothetical protein
MIDMVTRTYNKYLEITIYKTDLHDIAEILLKGALNTINITLEVISKKTYLDPYLLFII